MTAGLNVGIDAGPMLGEGGISGYVGPLVQALLENDPSSHYHLVLRRGWLSRGGADALPALAPTTRLQVPDRLLSLWWDWLCLLYTSDAADE